MSGEDLPKPIETMTPAKRPTSRRRTRKSALLIEVEDFLREIRPDAEERAAGYVAEMMVTAIRLLEDRTSLGEVKLLNAALRELRLAFGVFARYRATRKVTTFGSARTAAGEPAYQQAERFSRRIAEEGFMVITGAGGGIMRACQEGAGRERSFGVNIRLPFEQVANEFISGDAKLVTFKYFFTRKLLFIKEADAVVLFPGGFGTHDEAYEVLTLVQTGKTPPVPIVFLDAPKGCFWKRWRDDVERHLVGERLVSGEDMALFRVTDDVEEAVAEVKTFYRVYHSSRYVGEKLVIRMNRDPGPAMVERLQSEFSDILVSGQFAVRPAFPEEERDDTIALPRLVLHFNRLNVGRLRQMIDVLNSAPE